MYLPISQLQRGMTNILIVDDHQLMIDGIKTTLEDVEGLQIVNHAIMEMRHLKYLKKQGISR